MTQPSFMHRVQPRIPRSPVTLQYTPRRRKISGLPLPSQDRMTKVYIAANWNKKTEHEKSSVRYKVEHQFLIVKRLFHAGRTRYRGSRKNLLRAYLLFASDNLLMCLKAGIRRGMTMGYVRSFSRISLLGGWKKGAMGAVCTLFFTVLCEICVWRSDGCDYPLFSQSINGGLK